MELKLVDSCFTYDMAEKLCYADQSAAIMEAVDVLNKEYVNGLISVVSLNKYRTDVCLESPIWYEIKSYTTLHHHVVPDECYFFSSHYIGRFTHKDVNIVIIPRFGLFSYMLNYATNIFIPPLGETGFKKAIGNPYWLIGLLWKALLDKALINEQIPKEYQKVNNNQKRFLGRLLINKHIHANLCDASRFYCSYEIMTMDTLINRVIRASYKCLKEQGVGNILNDTEGYDQRLAALGVRDYINNIEEIDNIKYNRLTDCYLPLMNICKIILSNQQQNGYNQENSKGLSYFLDVAEIWELYLLKILQRNLSREYRIYSPNSSKGQWLLDENMREVRPDILIEKAGKVIMIIDAKYKRYSCIGKSTTLKGAVQREDLYQMTTYIHHFSEIGRPIAGIFSSPSAQNEMDICNFFKNPIQKIGVVNLKIEGEQSLKEIKHAEKEYVENICTLLKQLDRTNLQK